MMKCLFSLVVAICAGFCGAASVREVFENPPREARVQVWYHWISDCITEEGLVRDFEAMGEADVGTAHVFAPSMANLPVKAKPMSEEWLRLFAVAIREAKKHDITLGFHNCPGWSSSGGPWITPENSMKRIVSSAVDVPAEGDAALKIPQPLTNADYYRDLVAYAFPLPEEIVPLSGPFPLSCADGKTSRAVSGEVTFARPVKPGFFVFSPKPGRFAASVRVEAWADGRWVKAAEQTWGMWDHTPGERVLRLSYPGQVSRFRVTCTPGALHPTMGQNTAAIEKGTFSCLPLLEEVAKCNSATSALQDLPAGNPSEKGIDPSRILDVSRFLASDGTFDVAAARAAKALPACGADERCRIVRIGFTSTGKGPSPATIKGLECDKLDRRGIEAHWAAMPAKILALPGAKGTVKYCIIDSYEVGGQNWSGLLPHEFAKRRGYGIGKNLLCVCGYRIGTTGASRAFLHDWQRTIAELFAENYYDRFTELCHEAGVESILEPYGGPYVAMRAGRSADVPTGEFWLGGGTCGGSPRIAASLGHLNGRTRIAAESFTTDAKEGRWQLTPHELRTVGDASAWLQGINQIVVHSYLHQAFPNVKPGLSLGHHGSQINVNTTWWPEMREWTRYVRRGQALLQYGKPQADVLVLGGGYQQDLFALGMNFDLCCQEDILRLQPAADGGVAAPGQLPYRLLVVQAEASRLHPETQQALAALEKAGCRIAWGPSVAAVRKFGLRSFFEAPDALRAAYREGTDGSRIWFVVNMKGEPFYGVADFAAPAETLPEIFDAVSGTVRAVPNVDGDAGRTKVLLDLPAKGSAFVVFSREAKRTLADVPHELISPERLPVTVEKAVFRACDDHSRLADVTSRVQALVAAGDPFAVTCHALSVRDPASMHYKELVATYRVDGGEAQTAVFAEHKSALLKFFRPFVRQENRGKTTDLSSGWTITSFEGPCAPTAPLALPKLASWSASADPKLRHFAGRATYERKVEGWSLKVEGCKRTVLDLGDVRDIAKVWVDDTYVGCLWEPPYRIDITDRISTSTSSLNLKVEVVNTWPNRLIGDAKARAAGAAEPRGACGVPQWVLDGKADSGTGIYTWSNFGNAWKADEPLLPAGLIGPVCLEKCLQTVDAVSSPRQKEEENTYLTKLADPSIGTAATGHAFPGPCRPFGLVQPSPDTGNGSWKYCSGYAWTDSSVRRFSQTHLSGTGQAGLGDVGFLPFVGDVPDPKTMSASFAKDDERIELGYYGVKLDNGVRVEIASGRRLARYRLTFPSGRRGGVLLDFPWGLYRQKEYLPHLTTTCEVSRVSACRWTAFNHSDVWAPRDIHSVVEFDRSPDDVVALPREDGDKGPRIAVIFAKGGVVELAVALSAQSLAGAVRNFDAECGLGFDRLVSDARAEWATLLSRIDIDRVPAGERTSVVTSVYRLCLQPNDISDVGEPPRYSTFSLWDTFRDAHPLYETLVPERVPGFVNSLLAHYDRWGYLPQWELWGRETGGMIGSHAVPVIADAVEHGFGGFDRERAYRAVWDTLRRSERPGMGVTYPRRTDWEVLDRYGYYPYDVVRRESVSRTLECCYDDARAARLAKAMGKAEDAAFFERRSWAFTNLFDAATCCFRPKDSKGRWLPDFNPAGLSPHFTEGSALQWSWYVLHRPEWLVGAMGGKAAFESRLDAFFAGKLCPGADRGNCQDITGLIGDYAHGNEPCHHVIDLYRLIGRSDKAELLERQVCDRFYRPTPDGLCGNDDCGQMSAWYLRRRAGVMRP